MSGKIEKVTNAALKEDALNRNPSRTRSKKYIERLEEYRDLGLSLQPETDSLPTPETVLRVMAIVKKIAKGETKLDLLEWIQNEYGIGESGAKKYYTAACNFLIPEEGSESKERAIAILQTRYEQLYKRAYEANQLKTARDILDSLAKLQGLTGGNTVKIAENAEGDRMIEISFD